MYLTDGCRFLISCVIQHYAPVVGGGRNRCIMLIMTLETNTRGSNLGRLRHRQALYLKSYLDSLYCE